MNNSFPYGRQEISAADIEAVTNALRGELITQGPLISRFEDALADHLGARHAVAFSSGTAALHAAAAAAQLEPGDEVLTPALSFAASANCALYVRARPRFVDIDAATWNIDTEAAVRAVTPGTRAVVAVSYSGLPVDLTQLDEIRDRVVVIEDACHALGAVRPRGKVGGRGGADMTAFSFHPVKALTTGEGGMVTTNDDELALRLRRFRMHGFSTDAPGRSSTDGGWWYDMVDLGFNYRITDFQCALGLSQLPRLEGWVERRNAIAARYRELLDDDDRLELPPDAPPGYRHGYHLFVVRVRAGVDARLRVYDALRRRGIGAQVHYIPIYRLAYYRQVLGYRQDECPVTERVYAGILSLPIFPALADRDVDRVVHELRTALE